MSSSKIIKQANGLNSEVLEFSFKNIGQNSVASHDSQNLGGFVPMGLFQTENLLAASEDEDAETGPPPIEISEEALNQKISDSFNEGLKEGKDLAERGLINVFRALRASSETIHNLRDKIFRESEEEIIKLIILAARKVIIREVSQDRSIIAEVVQNALAGLAVREEITVHLNPDDYLMVTSGRDDLLQKELLNERLLLKPDPAVATGFCLVETDMGVIDASLDSQMEQLYRSLIEQRTVTVPVAES